MAEGGRSQNELPWAHCSRTFFEAEVANASVDDVAAGAPVYSDKRWEKPELKVFFMQPVPPAWKLIKETILQWANAWKSEELEMVPKFVEVEEDEEMEDSDVRIQFSNECGCGSRIGTEAEGYEDEATMVLNLQYPDDNFREYLVVHEFGHVLGLGHEHQMSHVANALDEGAMINHLMVDHGLDEKSARWKFVLDYQHYAEALAPAHPEGVDFDPTSVMCYPIPQRCIRNVDGRFSQEQLDALSSQDYRQRKRLSRVDKVTITKLYT